MGRQAAGGKIGGTRGRRWGELAVSPPPQPPQPQPSAPGRPPAPCRRHSRPGRSGSPSRRWARGWRRWRCPGAPRHPGVCQSWLGGCRDAWGRLCGCCDRRSLSRVACKQLGRAQSGASSDQRSAERGVFVPSRRGRLHGVVVCCWLAEERRALIRERLLSDSSREAGGEGGSRGQSGAGAPAARPPPSGCAAADRAAAALFYTFRVVHLPHCTE